MMPNAALSQSIADALIERIGQTGAPPTERFDMVIFDLIAANDSEQLTLLDAKRVHRASRAKLKEEFQILNLGWAAYRRDKERLEGAVSRRRPRASRPQPGQVSSLRSIGETNA